MSVIRIKPEANKLLRQEQKKLSPSPSISELASWVILKFYEPKKKRTTHPSFKEMRDVYEYYWKLYNRFDYQWNGPADASALNRLILNLENINEGNKTVVEFFKTVMHNLPEYWKDKSLNAINKNLNGILADSNKGKKQTGKVSDGGKFDFRN